MISKELLSAVLPHGENSIEAIEMQDGELSVLYRRGGWKYHNIYELAHKCKEWALSRNVSLRSFLDFGDHWFAQISNPVDNVQKSFLSDTEPESIFKACQWILDKEQTCQN